MTDLFLGEDIGNLTLFQAGGESGAKTFITTNHLEDLLNGSHSHRLKHDYYRNVLPTHTKHHNISPKHNTSASYDGVVDNESGMVENIWHEMLVQSHDAAVQ